MKVRRRNLGASLIAGNKPHPAAAAAASDPALAMTKTPIIETRMAMHCRSPGVSRNRAKTLTMVIIGVADCSSSPLVAVG